MIVESAQMLSTTHRMIDGSMERRLSKSGKVRVQYWKLPDEREDILYKACHFNHPSTIWTRESLENLSLESIEFAFLDGGHSYETVMNDLNILEKKLKKNAIILCDDYEGKTKIDSVTNAINDFVNKKGLLIEKKFQRFALIKIN